MASPPLLPAGNPVSGRVSPPFVDPSALSPSAADPATLSTQFSDALDDLAKAAQNADDLATFYRDLLPPGTPPAFQVGAGAQVKAAIAKIDAASSAALYAIADLKRQVAALQAAAAAAPAPVLPPAVTITNPSPTGVTPHAGMTPGTAGAFGVAAGLVVGSVATMALMKAKGRGR